MPRNYSETPRAPRKRQQTCTTCCVDVFVRVRQANSCIESVSSATRVPCIRRRPSDSRRTPPWARVTPADRTAAVTGSQPCRGRSADPPGAVAASRRFKVPGAPPPLLPFPQTQRRARAWSITSSPDRLTRMQIDRAKASHPCIVSVFTTNILPSAEPKYFVLIDFIFMRYEIVLDENLQLYDGRYSNNDFM